MSTEWIIYLIGCAVAFIIVCTIDVKYYKDGFDFSLKDIMEILIATTSSWVSVLCILVTLLVDVNDIILIKGKE